MWQEGVDEMLGSRVAWQEAGGGSKVLSKLCVCSRLVGFSPSSPCFCTS